ncbi:MAG: TatD family hydrolase [Rikenellaceae bacterium]
MSNIPPYINIHTHREVENELTISTHGIHPYHSESGARLSPESIDNSIEAIGEIGLDFSRPINPETQESLFREQLDIALSQGLPVVIHAVRAVDRVLEILKEYKGLKAVIFHGFIGSMQQAQRATDSGYFLSFGHRTFSSPKSLEALRNTPITNLFFETDQHDITIEEIYKMGTEFRTESIEELREAIYKNYINIFKK